MAHPRHEEIRRRYGGRCGYCGVTETETGGELTVDHFRPVIAAGGDGDDNLVYACFRCNTYKADFFPDESDLRHGRRVLHPLLDPVTAHVREDEGSGRLEPLTETGGFHILLLRLNRPQLVEQRLTRRLHHLLAESCTLLRNENEELHRRVVLLGTYLRELKRALGVRGADDESSPSDAR
jgi:hypothetical protein